MVAPFNQAWMLLKQRGHELNLPPPRIMGDNPARSLSPQDLIDRRVNRASAQHHILDDFEGMAQMSPRIANISDARRHLEDNQFNQQALANALEDAERNQAEEGHFERLQGDLDRQTLARMGQQPEADEMEAMGVPEMSRSIGGRGPAPNEGRAGSSGRPPVGSDDISDDLAEHEPNWAKGYTNTLNELGPLENPFTQKPVTTQHLEDSLQDWAAGAGREAGVPDIVERTENPFEDLTEMHDDDMYEEIHGEPLDENNPAKHTIASTTLRASPRHQRRGQMDSGRPYFKKPDREGPIGMSPSQRMLQQMGL